MRFLSLFLCVVSTSFSAAITLSTTCTSSGEINTGVASCNISDGVGSGQAQASASLSVSGNILSLDAHTWANALPGISSGFSQAQFSASSNVAVSVNLFTNGPLRLGYVEISGGSQTTAAGFGSANISASVGTALNLGCGVNQSCYSLSNTLQPFELGTSFTFSQTQHSTGQSDIIQNQGDSVANTSETFTFFEADGVTPVAVFDAASAVPEPAAWTLFALGLAGLGALSFRTKR